MLFINYMTLVDWHTVLCVLLLYDVLCVYKYIHHAVDVAVAVACPWKNKIVYIVQQSTYISVSKTPKKNRLTKNETGLLVCAKQLHAIFLSLRPVYSWHYPQNNSTLHILSCPLMVLSPQLLKWLVRRKKKLCSFAMYLLCLYSVSFDVRKDIVLWSTQVLPVPFRGFAMAVVAPCVLDSSFRNKSLFFCLIVISVTI